MAETRNQAENQPKSSSKGTRRFGITPYGISAESWKSKEYKEQLQTIRTSILESWKKGRHGSRWAGCCLTLLRYGVADLGHPKEQIRTLKQIMKEYHMKDKEQLIPWISTQCQLANEPYMSIVPSINMRHPVENEDYPVEKRKLLVDAPVIREEEQSTKSDTEAQVLKALYEESVTRVSELELALEVAKEDTSILKIELNQVRKQEKKLEHKCRYLIELNEAYVHHVATMVEPALKWKNAVMRENEKLFEAKWQLQEENSRLQQHVMELELYLGKRTNTNLPLDQSEAEQLRSREFLQFAKSHPVIHGLPK